LRLENWDRRFAGIIAPEEDHSAGKKELVNFSLGNVVAPQRDFADDTHLAETAMVDDEHIFQR
jgi:hypothetical protein